MSDVVDLFIRLNGLKEASQGLRGVSDDLVKSKQEQKRLSIINQQEALKERKAVQELRVEQAKRQVILRGSQADIARSIQAQNQLAGILRSQEVVKLRLANFDKEMIQTGSTGWESLRKILQGNTSEVGMLGASLKSAMGIGTTASVALAGAIGVGVVGALTLATAGVNELITGFQKAKDLSESTIASVTATSRDFGLSRGDARKFVTENQRNVELAGKALPISSEDINRALTIGLNSGIIGLSEKDKSFFQQNVVGNASQTGLFSKLALLRQQLGSQITEPQFAQAIATISNEKSGKSDINTEFFRTSGLGKFLQEEGYLETQGKERIKAINRALDKLIPQDAIDEQQGTISARFSSFYDSLFAPLTGTFGFLRPLEDGRSTYDEILKTTELIFGEGGTLSQLASTFGGTGDVMEDLKSTIVGLNELIQDINNLLKIFKKTDAQKIEENQFNQEKVFSRQAFLQSSGKQATNFLDELGLSLGTYIKQEVSRPFRYNLDGTLKAQPNYQGLIQSFKPAYAGFNSAYNLERQNKPAGTKIGLLFNSGEDILPPGKLAQIMNTSYSRGRDTQRPPIAVTVASGAITVNPQPGQDPGAIARMTLDLFLSDLGKELENRI
jgi:hypothetical protein